MEIDEQKKTVFIIVRHIDSVATSQLWKHSYYSIRRLYPHSDVIIIDNDSDEKFVDSDPRMSVPIIKSEVPKTRYFAGYYYYLLYLQHYERACILHDSVIFHNTIDLSNFKNVKFLWHFESHEGDTPNLAIDMLKNLHNNESLIELYLSKNWHGSLGCISVIEGSFLQKLQSNYNFINLASCLDDNAKALELERIFAVLCYHAYPELKYNPSFFGKHTTLTWGLFFDLYLQDFDIHSKRPAVKLFAKRLGI
jgi:hypothetical protein